MVPNLETRVVTVYKSLGCKVEIPIAAEREKAGISAAEASQNKKAVLKAPVEFPRDRIRGQTRRR